MCKRIFCRSLITILSFLNSWVPPNYWQG